MNIRIGLVGLGTGGRSLPLAIRKTSGFDFVAGADLREKARAQYAAEFGVQTFDSVEAMCAMKDLDAVYVATPNPFHAPHAMAAMERGKHVMVEKPMALTLEDCDRMIAAAEKNRVKLMVAHTRSFNEPIRKMREIISSGRLGRVTQVHTLRYSPWLLRPREPVEIDTTLGGGVCYRQAPHQVDIARLLAGGVARSVRAMAGRWSPENATEGNYSALIEFAGGVAATLIYDGYGYFDDRELIEGDVFGGREAVTAGQRLRKARAEGNLDKDTSRSGVAFDIERGDAPAERRPRQPFFGLTLVSCERGALRQSSKGVFVYDEKGRSEELCSEWQGPLRVELGDFYKAVREDKPMPHDGHWGKATLEVCLAILRSSRDGSEHKLAWQVASRY
ncbi:MAG: Gfo/Idh/MocA family oxidoreductase [Deltaproteobacteria bacterium]|nr:Gfo/Idh/MocA family oxidoreductase [Deltaproteobacteria bacterium]MBM4296781.1 Gfo/Idh/MocA family oxidoreductase [Deltaproteobacteria bacterium]